MHKVERNEPPEGLSEKSLEFKKQLKENKNADGWEKFSGTKLKKATVKQLNDMYKGCCAYCEGRFVSTSYANIEHFKPKKLYPELTFEYDNMNLACSVCNSNKGDFFDKKIIDPSKDEPDEHIQFEGYNAIALDERGATTISLFRLNDDERLIDKKFGYDSVKQSMDMVYRNIDKINSKNEETLEIIKDVISSVIRDTEPLFEHGKAYCTMFRHNFGKEIESLKKILNKIA